MNIQRAYFIRWILPAMALILIAIPAKAQLPILVHNPDTTYFLEAPTLGEITVTANRESDYTSLSNLIGTSEITTSVSGITKDLQRDLPSMIRIYTDQGFPLLTKYTSNNSLTSAIPDSAVSLELREPGAKFPNPDAPVILRPAYGQRGSLSLSPLTQDLSLGFGDPDTVAGRVSLSHSGAFNGFEQFIPELQAYNTTYSGFGSFRTELFDTQIEVTLQHSQSHNNYSDLLNIDKLKESDQGTNVFLSYSVPLGKQTLDAGIIHQRGKEHRQVEDLNTGYNTTNEIEATAYTIALGNKTSEVRAIYHNLHRIYPWSRDSVSMRRVETLITHRQQLSQGISLKVEARFDHRDGEPSLGGELHFHPHEKVMLSFNAGRLYDAIGSEALNNLMYSVQIAPHPWTVTFTRLGTDFYLDNASIHAAVGQKKIQRGWYGKTAYAQGWVGRLGAKGILVTSAREHFNLSWNLEGVSREFSLDTEGSPSQIMPGIARFEGHASLDLNLGNMSYSLQTDTFIDRHLRISEDVSANLGSQYFLSMAATRKMGAIKLGVSINNALNLVGKKNYIMAHYSKGSGMKYVSAPPFVNINLGITFY